MDPLEREFDRRMRDSVDKSIELGCYPNRVVEMLKTHGARETARLLVKSGEIQDGLRRIVKKGHPEWSVGIDHAGPKIRAAVHIRGVGGSTMAS